MHCGFASLSITAYTRRTSKTLGFRTSVVRANRNVKAVFWKKRNKEEHRYYLLPGMGKANRRKHRQYFHSALVVGVLVSLILCSLLYYFSRPHL